MSQIEKETHQWRAIFFRLLMGSQTLRGEELKEQWGFAITFLRSALRPEAKKGFEAALAIFDICPFGGIPFTPEADAIEEGMKEKATAEEGIGGWQ